MVFQECVMSTPRITLIGGPTVLIEVGGFRLLTDPTFDAPGEYQLPHAVLRKTAGPALAAAEIGPVDAVLLSHDQHADNLDKSGRDFLAKAARVSRSLASGCRAPVRGRDRLRADLPERNPAHLH